MSTELTLDLIKVQLDNKTKELVDDSTVQEVKNLMEDPEYGPEFLDIYLTHLSVLKKQLRANHPQYLAATKFFTLVESGCNLTESYIKVFPDRYQARSDKFGKEKAKSLMQRESSKFNKSVLVNEIRQMNAVPIHLIHRNLLHEAILESANIMRFSKSDIARQKAAATLIAELKPPESAININVNDTGSSVIEDLNKAVQALAAEQRQTVMAGGSLVKVAQSSIIDITPEQED